ncbi:MAG TPA: 50S ribosomal protein L25 [Chloroflexi bacterium]|nr:50S ribosomal protein L25 [Chloroflexota bacterium]
MSQQKEQITLAAQTRSLLGKKSKRLRREGWVPGVMYGHNFDPIPLQFEYKELRQLLSEVGGSQIIGIAIGEQDQTEMALIRDVQKDPIRQNVLHVDFYRVDMAERLTTEIPLELIGEPAIIEQNEGILLIGVSSIEVECLPGDLVDALEVDLTELEEINDALYVRDLAIPAGIDVLTDVDEMIARVVPLEEEAILELEEEEEEMLIAEAPEVEVITEAGREEAFTEEDEEMEKTE